MPELPEVETIVKALREGGRGGAMLPGKEISEVRLLWPGSVAAPLAAEFARRLPGRKVDAVDRRGKFIVIRLDEGTMLVHLRMSGDLQMKNGRDGSEQDAAHDRVVLGFSDKSRLVFNDARKFGRVWLVDEPQEVLGRLGPEPLDNNLTGEGFHQMLSGRHRQLKPLLIDQSFLAGLGNIYVDESLHKAGLHPGRSSDSLDWKRSARLLESIRSTLREGISRNGASIDWVYRGGDFQNSFRVYQRAGKPCPVCGNPIERRVIGQRGTHFCPVCQPEG